MKKTDKKKFESCVEMVSESGCWVWMRGVAGPLHYQYGACNLENKTTRAHRAAWMIYQGSIPKGIDVLHRCDTPLCVNPNHLFLGTHFDNMHDAIKKNRANIIFKHRKFLGEENGHARLTNEIVKEIKSSNEKTKNIAAKFKITINTVSQIRAGVRWPHIIP